MIKECEICINPFPIDCFEFLPCFHKLCLFCYNDIKNSITNSYDSLKCPFCRNEINNTEYNKNNIQNETEDDYDENYNLNNEEYYIDKMHKKHKIHKLKHKRINYSENFNNL